MRTKSTEEDHKKKMKLSTFQLSYFENNSKKNDYLSALQNTKQKDFEILVFTIIVTNDEIENAFGRKIIGVKFKFFSVPCGVNELKGIKNTWKPIFQQTKKEMVL